MLPSRYAIDYEGVLSAVREQSAFDTALLLRNRLPSVWREVYLSTITHEPNFIWFRHRTFEYICDLYSRLEMAGLVPYDQTIADRVIGVLGMSSRAQEDHRTKRGRIELSEELEGTQRDDECGILCKNGKLAASGAAIDLPPSSP